MLLLLAVTADPLAPQDPLAQKKGQIIGERYLVGDVLGGGGMGVFREGTHALLGTPVAIKVIHSELKGDPEVVQRFINEARAAAALKGEHIARVFDVGMLDSGEPYLVMEQLEGVGLDLHLAGRGPLGVAETVAIVLQVSEGLAEAHAAGLVHRDIKPANLFLARRPDDQLCVKILDFGIAKRVATSSPALTDPGKSLGSPWYMSPEQMLTPSSVDARADVWSLGVLLFELLTARLPFEGESVPHVCANVLAAPPPRPREYRGDLDPELEAIILHCLEKEPRRRFDSVSELAEALLPFAAIAHSEASEPMVGLGARLPTTYDSLTPIHGSAHSWRSRSPGWRRIGPLVFALVLAAIALPQAWLRAGSEPAADSVRGALGFPALLSPELASSADIAPQLSALTREPPRLLQYLHDADAVPELDRPESNSMFWPPSPRPSAVGWARAQELKRLYDSENRYGL